MDIVFLPDNGDHPYQKLLKAALEDLGARVWPGVRGGPLPLAASLLKRRPAVVHLHWLNPYLLGRNLPVSLVKSVLFSLQLLLCRLAGVKIVWTIHNFHNHEKYLYRMERFFCRLTAALADALIVHAGAHLAELEREYGARGARKAFVVPQGNYSAFYPGGLPAGQARARLGLPGGGKVFLFFGSLRAYKGVEELIEAFKGLQGPGLVLVIAGRPYDENIRRSLEEAVLGDGRIRLFAGFVPDKEVRAYFDAADAVILPYREITTSAALLLAMSCGKPVIAPALPYIREMLPADGGVLYDPAAAGGLRAALELALAADLPAMGRRALARAAEFTWEGAAGKTYAVYEARLK